MKIKISKKISEYFSSYKSKFNRKNKYDWASEVDEPVIGQIWWTVPDEVLWLYATNNSEGYEGSQTQIGIKKDGTLVWGYFSHCSCYNYSSYKGEVKELTEDNLIHTQKYYELEKIDIGAMDLIKKRIKQINKIGLKD